MDIYEAGTLIAVFAISVFILNFFGLIQMAILLGIVLIDKVVLCQLKVQGHFGIEVQTIPTVLAGIIYGPVVGFLFGFFILTLMDFFTLVFAPPFEMDWVPGLPSYNSTIYGIVAVLAWFLYPVFGLVAIVVVCTIIKSMAFMFKDFVIKGVPNILAAVINTMLNFTMMRALVDLGFTAFLGL